MEQLKPEKILTPERFMEYEQSIRKSDLIPNVLKLITKPNMKICDIGGASGVFLNEIIKKSKHIIRAYNMEVLPEYKSKQLNEKIDFLHASILDSTLKDKSFNIISFRHLLHHLVGRTLKQTKQNQTRALEEMFRLLKPGGHLIFEEEVNEIPIFSQAIYYLSHFAHKHKIKVKSFDAGTVVVYFMNREEIKRILLGNSSKFNLIIKTEKYTRWNTELRWKLTLLMSRVGTVGFCVEKLKDV